MLATLVRTRLPDRAICALDEEWRPAWRVALIPSYKTHRLAGNGGDNAEIVPDPLSRQVPILLDVLAAFGIATAGAPDYEADDVIGTLAAREPGPIEVATGDRDLFQVIDDARAVRVLYTGRGVAKLEVYDNAVVQERYGVPAASYADFAALRGDPSDGLPGVNGIGDKSAARLVTRYGSLAGILAAVTDPAAGFAPGLRTKLVAAADYLAVAPTVVRVATGVPLPPLEPALPDAPRSPQRLAELTERWGLSGSARRLTEALALTATQS
jgi:5'-3' exonuclease